MHRKSLEAAETLKDSENENSDKEEGKTQESDGSVISNLSKAPSASPKSNSLNNNNSNANNNSGNTPSNPTGSPPIMSHHNSHHPQQQQQQQPGGGVHHSPPLPHHLMAHHPSAAGTGGGGGGGSPMDSARQDYNSSTSPSNSNRSYPSLHDTDTEVFRWVDYNQHSIR